MKSKMSNNALAAGLVWSDAALHIVLSSSVLKRVDIDQCMHAMVVPTLLQLTSLRERVFFTTITKRKRDQARKVKTNVKAGQYTDWVID